MYNGIGVITPRGTGTNGHIQANRALIRQHKERVDYAKPKDFNKIDEVLLRKGNKEILEHENKRKIELKCVELQDMMEDQGYSDTEIEDKVGELRRLLTDSAALLEATDDGSHKPKTFERHVTAELNEKKNEAFKDAMGLSGYVAGSSFSKDDSFAIPAGKVVAKPGGTAEIAGKKHKKLKKKRVRRSPSSSSSSSSSSEEEEKRSRVRNRKKGKHVRESGSGSG